MIFIQASLTAQEVVNHQKKYSCIHHPDNNYNLPMTKQEVVSVRVFAVL